MGSVTAGGSSHIGTAGGQVDKGIAHLVLARHDIRNAYSEKEFTEEIVDALARVQGDRGARVLVLSAEGTSFSAGGNVKDMRDKKGMFGGGPAGTRQGYIEGIQRIPKALNGLDSDGGKVVAGIAGNQGGGLQIIVGCDQGLKGGTAQAQY